MTDKCRTILVIDDEPDVYWALKQLLKRMGYLTVKAKNSKEALCLMKQAPFYLAFLDAKLPNGEGIELVLQLRRIQPDLRVVLISGYFYEDDNKVQEWIREGLICGFISKPFLHQEIRQVVLEGNSVER